MLQGDQERTGDGSSLTRARFHMQKTPAKILIVDDAPAFCEALKWLLDFEGYDCTVAANGQIAIDLLEDLETHLILLDWEMPIMNGAEFLAERKLHPKLISIPVLVLSAAVNIKLAAARLGATNFLQKPVDFEHLLVEIKSVLS